MPSSDDTSPDRPMADLISGGRTIAMLMTMIGSEHTSRPLTCVEVDDDRLAFLVSKDFDWVKAIQAGRATVHVTVADDGHNTYLALNGDATITDRIDDLRRLWTPAAKVWFEGADDPRLAAVYFVVRSGEYWDGPNGKVSQAIAMVRGLITGDQNAVGDQGSVTGADDR